MTATTACRQDGATHDDVTDRARQLRVDSVSTGRRMCDVAPVRELSISPVRPSDASALIALFDRSSARTRRERFHGTVRGFPAQYLNDIVSGAPGVVARVARDLRSDPSGACIVALATASIEPDGRAELGAWVADEWQRRGIGAQVLRAVLEQLRADGVRIAVAYVEPGNHAALSLARRVARDPGVALTAGPAITFELSPVRTEMTERSSTAVLRVA